MNLAIFDFDGTISTKDSFVDFIVFAHGGLKARLGFILLSPVLFLYLLKILPGHQTKECFLTLFFHGWEEERFRRKAEEYANTALIHIIRQQAREKIVWHKSQGHQVVVVSASFEEYLRVWCERQHIDIIATRAQFSNGKVTGALSTPNCYGVEKINRLKQKYNLENFKYIYAYGDSNGDLPLKTIAHEFHYQLFQ